MQNDNTDPAKCGLSERSEGQFLDLITTDSYIWHEIDWQHDDYSHSHQRYQLTYVEEGYQYFHIDNKIHLVPQHHVIWIPSQIIHKVSSEADTVSLWAIFFKNIPTKEFYNKVHVFPAPSLLKEMLIYASKWNKQLNDDSEKTIFLKALLTCLPHFCAENKALQIPIPTDPRLQPVCEFINTNFPFHFTISELADVAQMTVRSLQRAFKQQTGITLQKYIQLIRVLKSIELIDTRQFTLSQIAFKVGYGSLSAFTTSYFSIMKSKAKSKK